MHNLGGKSDMKKLIFFFLVFIAIPITSMHHKPKKTEDEVSAPDENRLSEVVPYQVPSVHNTSVGYVPMMPMMCAVSVLTFCLWKSHTSNLPKE